MSLKEYLGRTKHTKIYNHVREEIKVAYYHAH